MIRSVVFSFILVSSSLFAVMDKNAKIWVAGHRGLVGSAIVRKLQEDGYTNLVMRTHAALDLVDSVAVKAFYEKERPEYVILAAAKVGGIMSNLTYPADFIRDNLGVQQNVLGYAYDFGVKKLLFLGSSCIYPKLCPQPIKEEYLLTSALEPTNDAYAIAKIAGLKFCQAYQKQYGACFVSLMPTNLYGPRDNYDRFNSHVLPALIRKLVEAKENGDAFVTMWGTGVAKREFLYVDDLADAVLWAMNFYEGDQWLNVGTGKDISIKEVAYLIASLVGYDGEFVWDSSKPDGTPRKLLDVSKINELGWEAKTPLKEGLQKAIDWYLENRV